MSFHPHGAFVSSEQRPVKPLVYVPKKIQPTGIARVCMVNDSVNQHKSTHSRSFPCVSWPVGTNSRCNFYFFSRGLIFFVNIAVAGAYIAFVVVILCVSSTLLLFSKRNMEVVIKITAKRRRPGEMSIPSFFKSLEFGNWRT
jgi:hypothetical protein